MFCALSTMYLRERLVENRVGRDQSKITENLRGPGSGVGWSVPCHGGVAFRMIGRSGVRRATTWKPHPAKTEAIPV